MLPDTRNEVMVAGVSTVPSATWNQFSDEIIKLWRASRGADTLIFDDFFGDAINRGIWASPTGAAINVDYLAGSRGAVALTPPDGGGASLSTQALALDTRDWRFGVRCRIPNYGAWAAGNLCTVGLGPGALTSQHSFYFQIKKGTNGDRFTAQVDIAAGVDTGIAADAAYHFFEIRRSGSTVSFLIDGVQVYATAFVATMNSYLLVQSSAPLATNLIIDKIGFWASDYPSSGSSAAAASSHNNQGGVVTFDGTVDFIDVVFTTDFVDTNYQFKLGALLAAAGDSPFSPCFGPTPAVDPKHGLRILTDFRVPNGTKVSWEVWK